MIEAWLCMHTVIEFCRAKSRELCCALVKFNNFLKYLVEQLHLM